MNTYESTLLLVSVFAVGALVGYIIRDRADRPRKLRSKDKTVEVNMADVKFEFCSSTGEPLARGEYASNPRFRVSIPNVDSLRVRRIEFPVLDYGDTNTLLAKVDVYMGEL